MRASTRPGSLTLRGLLAIDPSRLVRVRPRFAGRRRRRQDRRRRGRVGAAAGGPRGQRAVPRDHLEQRPSPDEERVAQRLLPRRPGAADLQPARGWPPQARGDLGPQPSGGQARPRRGRRSRPARSDPSVPARRRPTSPPCRRRPRPSEPAGAGPRTTRRRVGPASRSSPRSTAGSARARRRGDTVETDEVVYQIADLSAGRPGRHRRGRPARRRGDAPARPTGPSASTAGPTTCPCSTRSRRSASRSTRTRTPRRSPGSSRTGTSGSTRVSRSRPSSRCRSTRSWSSSPTPPGSTPRGRPGLRPAQARRDGLRPAPVAGGPDRPRIPPRPRRRPRRQGRRARGRSGAEKLKAMLDGAAPMVRDR